MVSARPSAAAAASHADWLVGSKAPAIEIDYGFPPTKIDLAERVANKKVILVGLPGAFTPT